jgi:hypothetical protein
MSGVVGGNGDRNDVSVIFENDTEVSSRFKRVVV